MNSLLKFITCGSVDDGKSTLIGHMLYDAKLLFADQKRALELDSKDFHSFISLEDVWEDQTAVLLRTSLSDVARYSLR